MYSDSGDSTPSPAASKPEGSGEDEQKEGDTATALLPKSFFGSKPLEPGTRCEVEIEKVHEDEVQVSYVPMDKSKDKESPARDSAPDEMDTMMS